MPACICGKCGWLTNTAFCLHRIDPRHGCDARIDIERSLWVAGCDGADEAIVGDPVQTNGHTWSRDALIECKVALENESEAADAGG